MPEKKTRDHVENNNGLDLDRGGWIQNAAKDEIIAILDNAPCGIVINSSAGGDVLYINHESFNLMGYSVSEVPTGRAAQRTFLESPEDIEKSYAFEDELREKGKAVSTARMVTKSGALKYIELQGVVLPNESIVSMWTDVTRREIAKQELRESEAKFRTLFEQSSDAVLLLRDHTIIDCNHAAEKLFHTTDRKQIVNSTLKELSPGKQSNGSLSAEDASDIITKAIEKKSLRFQWQLQCFDDHIFWADISVTSIQLQGQKVLYTVLRDITAWKKAEQALLKARDELEDRVGERTSALLDVNRQLRSEIQRREQVESELKISREELRYLSEHLQRAREEERERIAREVHDELGQFLSALKIDVTCLGDTKHLGHNDLLEQTRNMERQIDSAIHSVRHICSELRPPILKDFGLPAAIEWYLDDFQKRTGIHCTADIDLNIPKEKKGLQLMLFRVFQEAMTNILRHAAATKVGVELSIASGVLTLKVKDNGKGITKRQIKNPRSFGLAGVRERVRFWGGWSHFKGSHNNGTAMTVTIPL